MLSAKIASRSDESHPSFFYRLNKGPTSARVLSHTTEGGPPGRNVGIGWIHSEFDSQGHVPCTAIQHHQPIQEWNDTSKTR